MDYTHFLRGALDLGTRAVGAYERHVTVAEGRLELDRDGPLPGELGPPPPPEAADGFAFHMPAAEPLQRTWTLHLDGNNLVLTDGVVDSHLPVFDPDADITDLQRAQAEVLIERARCEALERQVAELKAARRPSGIVRELADILDGRGTGRAARSRDVRAAVSGFQAALGLKDDGIVGPQTLLAIASLYAGRRP